MKRLISTAGLLVLIALPANCLAGHISLEIAASSRFAKGMCQVEVTISNKGDESARRIQVEATLGSTNVLTAVHPELGSNESYTTRIDLGLAPSPGTHTIIVKVRYTDGNNYPFTALSSVPILTAVPADDDPRLKAVLRSSRMSNKGAMQFEITSMSDETISLTARLIVPPELKCTPQTTVLMLQPGKTNTIIFSIDNVWAQPPSHYMVIAVADYEHGGRHESHSSTAHIAIQRPWYIATMSRKWQIGLIGAIVFLMLVFAGLQFLHYVPSPVYMQIGARLRKAFPWLVLTALLSFILYHIPPAYLLMDTVTTGGDTPAHNYLASHLSDQLFHHGRLVSWAEGWWCGFPMFQYYFVLPYLLIAILDLVIPFNIAFKLISVLGIVALPFSAHFAARIARLPKPCPSIMAIATLPFLFIRSHTMWGVSIYSTLAGMIANSLGFAIMVIFIASAYRDACDRRFRLSTALLMAAMLASHFFTSIVAVLAVAIMPFLTGRKNFIRSALILAAEGLLGTALMAWWLLPLIARREYAVDFGINWDVDLIRTLHPAAATGIALLSVTGIIIGIIRRHTFWIVIAWMLVASTALFYFGYDFVSPVFVNVRLWPFIFYSLVILSSLGVGFMLSRTKMPEIAVLAALICTLAFLIESPNHVYSWARWNYLGLENKPYWSVFKELVLPLDGTAGRLANDLHHDNSALGSSRVFETVPHLISKPILEGGIVNSAVGSIFSYYIQGESSQNCAGFPTIVQPTSFNITNATEHLALFNVKHFIARWPRTQEAMRQSPDWHFIRKSKGWELYALQNHDGSYVFVPPNNPIAVRLEKKGPPGHAWKQAGLDWMYEPRSLSQHFILLRDNEKVADTIRVIPESAYKTMLSEEREQVPPSIDVTSDETITSGRIRFRTSAIGKPHIIKYTYHPNWKVRGADKIYMVTPCFMLVYPEQQEVELYFGSTFPDHMGKLFTLAGTLCIGAVVWRRKLRCHSVDHSC